MSGLQEHDSARDIEDRIESRQGGALDLAFPDGTLDVVWMRNVGMNVTTANATPAVPGKLGLAGFVDDLVFVSQSASSHAITDAMPQSGGRPPPEARPPRRIRRPPEQSGETNE